MKDAVIAACVVALCLSICLLALASTASEKSKTPETPIGWTCTQDLIPKTGHVGAYILTDPQGQQFLLVRSSGVAIIPYTPKNKASVEASKD